MSPALTKITFVLDRSGSMSDIAARAVAEEDASERGKGPTDAR